MTTAHPAGIESSGIASPSPHTRGQGRSRIDRPSPPAPALIGVGVDGRPSGRDAVVLASLLGRPTGAELMLIAVYEEPLLEPLVPSEMGWTSVPKQARAMLAETRDSLAPRARVVVQRGVLAWRALRQVVRREHRDLLVVGSRGGAQDGEVRLGQTARDLLYHLECPLAIAPRGLRNVDKPRLERIGVGFDGGPEAGAALELAARVAAAAGAELEVRGVVDDRVPGGLTTGKFVLRGDAIADDASASLLDRALAAARATPAHAHVDIGRGDPAETLWTLGTGVDLLVIGSSRSGPAGRVSLGRSGSFLVDGAPCPVLITPKSGDDPAI